MLHIEIHSHNIHAPLMRTRGVTLFKHYQHLYPSARITGPDVLIKSTSRHHILPENPFNESVKPAILLLTNAEYIYTNFITITFTGDS
jgi:hypothetical protein